MRTDTAAVSPRHSAGLVDLLDRVLDKGLVIAGDIKVSLAEVELLTIRIRLIVCSLEKAESIGLDWWRYDRYLSPGQKNAINAENEALKAQVRRLEQRLASLTMQDGNGRPARRRTRRRRGIG
ncbi:MAG TPA: gas vesicle protein [Planctomycetota bacterium]|nr:gas vesicle protein [Planctomycetota bacterium]